MTNPSNPIGKIIKADGTMVDFVIANDKPTLMELRNVIDGYVEKVTIFQKVGWFADEAVMIIDEMAVVKYKPVNMKASEMVQRHIAGDVIVLPRRLVK